MMSFIGFMGLVAIGWFAGLIVFATRLPVSIENQSFQTDAIVVLTGGSERVATGVELLSGGAADRLFISGVGAAVGARDLIGRDLPDRESLIAKISLGSEAEDTPGNALETANWVAEEKISSFRLVTAAYHMPRSLYELKQVMPDVVIVPHPVFPEQVKPDWWRYPGTARLIASEYTKYLFSRFQGWLPFESGDPGENTGSTVP